MIRESDSAHPQVSCLTIATFVDRAVVACEEVVGKYIELKKKMDGFDSLDTPGLSSNVAMALGELYQETKRLNEGLQVLLEFKHAMMEVLDEPLPEALSHEVDAAAIDPYLTDEGFLRTIVTIVREKDPLSRMFCYAALLGKFKDEIAVRRDRIEKLKVRTRIEPNSEEAKTAKLLRAKNEAALEILEKRRVRIGQQFLKLRLYVLRRVLNASTKVSDMYPNGGMRMFEVREQLRSVRDNTMMFDSKTGEPIMTVKPELTDISTSLRLLWEEIVAQKMSRRQTENWMLNADTIHRRK